jgi:N-methylhydantoinase A/oxoprolinase/acetone carboxylase beta subunit
MLGALRLVTVQKGLDPRDFALVPFGGAGPLHGNAMAALAGCYPVIVPPTPGVLSALGFLYSDVKNEFAQTFVRTDRRRRPEPNRRHSYQARARCAGLAARGRHGRDAAARKL